MQASWSGSIVFGLVSVPVQLYKATEPHAGPKFHQVHEKDGGRIRLKRFCEVEDKEVPYREIAKGYDLGDEQELILTAEDFEALPIPSRATIEVQGFVHESTIDPMRFEQAYYVGLGKRSPGKPYALLREALREEGQIAIAKITLTTRESLAVLRVVDDLLILHTILWADEVRSARSIEPPEEKLHPNELKMAKSLMQQMSEDFDPDALHDEYREAVEELIEAKMHGQATTSPKPVPASNVVDISELLKRSLQAERGRRGEQREGGGAKKTAAKRSTRGRAEESAAESKPAGKKTAAKKSAPAKKTAAKTRGRRAG
jgi:DNA end-binding protein Ku